MANERSFHRQCMVSGFTQEAVYGQGVGAYSAGDYFGLVDFPESAYEQWDDETANNATLVSHTELPTHQEIVRKSVRFPFQEDRAKVNTLAWLLGMTMGLAVEDTQDGTAIAYRHKFDTSASGTDLPSVVVQTKRDGGAQYKYQGIIAGGVIMQGNGAFWQIQSELIGNGSRVASSDAIVAPIPEPWLLWGDGAIYVKDTGGVPESPGTPITLPTAPSQTTHDLGTGAKDLSRRVHTITLNWNNQLQADLGYRPGTHRLRQKFFPSRRTGTLELEFDIDNTTEATDLGYYLNQAQLAVEINMLQTHMADETPHLIDPAGTYFWGAKLIVPRLQLGTPTFGQRGEIETMRLTGTIMDDMTNPAMTFWVWNKQPAYLVP